MRVKIQEHVSKISLIFLSPNFIDLNVNATPQQLITSINPTSRKTISN